MGRPPIELPANAAALVAQRAYTGSPDREIAALLGVSESTLKRGFGPILTKRRAERHADIRKWQQNAAKKGNPAMLIWLGKQELGQKEPLERVEFSDADMDRMSPDELRLLAVGQVPPRLRVVR